MKIRTTSLMRRVVCGVAGLAVAASASISTAQEEEGRRRGRPELRDGDGAGERGERGGQRGGPGFERGGPGGPGGRGGPEMLMRMPVLAALDADRDGVISAKEIQGAVAALKTLDKNKDGKLVFEELVPQRGGPGGAGPDGRGAGGRGPGGPRPGGPRPGGPGAGGPRPGGPGQGGRGPGGFGGMDPKAILDRMMQQDKDGDGLLSGDEIPDRMAQMVERADKNGDGKLSRDEIEKAMANMRRGAGGGRPGGARNSDAPGGERPRRPPAE